MQALRGLGRFLSSLDPKALISLGVSVALMLTVSVFFYFGQAWVQFEDEGGLAAWLVTFSQSPAAVPATLTVFVVLALTGFPQWFLIAGTILAFGARDGALYSWLATMVSATVTFLLGRLMGGAWVELLGGERTRSMIELIGRHGILVSGLIRIIPTGPFIVVNATAGAARLPLWKYLAGTSVGIIPKILMVAALSALAPEDRTLAGGASGFSALFRSFTVADWALFATLGAGWLGLIFLVRQLYLALRRAESEPVTNPSTLPSGEESR